MGTLYIDRRDAALDWDAGAILVRLAGERAAQAPSAGLERVVVVAPATLTTRLLAELWRRDIGLILLAGRRKRPRGSSASRMPTPASGSRNTPRSATSRSGRAPPP